MRLFIAFDSGDQHLAELVVEVLRGWFGNSLHITFSAEFEFGDDWRDRLNEALQNADAVLAICTRRSIENRWIHFEAGAFHGRGQRVIPVTIGPLKPAELPEPLNTFQAPSMEVERDVGRLAQQIAQYAKLHVPANPEAAAGDFRAVSVTGLPASHEGIFTGFLKRAKLGPSGRAQVVMSASKQAHRFAVDDFIVLYTSPGWEGHTEREIKSEIGGPKLYHSEVERVATEYRQTRPDRDINQPKLGLVQIDPFMSDRERLRLVFEEMHYFDFEGPRRNLFQDDHATSFAAAHYLGRQIPEDIPTPLACLHTILVTADKKHIVLGLRRKGAKADFYDNRICIGFEEQMRPNESPVGTVQRGLREETGLDDLPSGQVRLLAIGVEASFFSMALIAIAYLPWNASQLHDSIVTKAKDHEWDALFLPADGRHLQELLAAPLPTWESLRASHFLTFSPELEYQWHGTSRFRLLCYLAHRYGIGRLAKGL